MSLMNCVEELEGLSSEGRKEIICSRLDDLGISYEAQNYGTGENIIVGSGKPKEIGISSHFDVVPRSPGANDNASAISVTLDVLRRVQEKPLDNIGVRGLFFDQEEVNTLGSRAYVNSRELKGLIGVYNMELVGVGDRLAFWCEGNLHEGLLLRTIEKQAKNRGIEAYRFPQISEFLYNAGDHRAFNEAGIKEAFCITVISPEDVDMAVKYFTEGYEKEDIVAVISQAPLFRHYHQPTDLSEHLEEKSLQMVSDLLYKSVCEIDRRY